MTLRQPVQQLVEFIPPEQVRMQALIPTPTQESTILERNLGEIQRAVLTEEEFPFQLNPDSPVRTFKVLRTTIELSTTIKYAESVEGDWLAIAQQGESTVVFGAIAGKQFSIDRLPGASAQGVAAVSSVEQINVAAFPEEEVVRVVPQSIFIPQPPQLTPQSTGPPQVKTKYLYTAAVAQADPQIVTKIALLNGLLNQGIVDSGGSGSFLLLPSAQVPYSENGSADSALDWLLQNAEAFGGEADTIHLITNDAVGSTCGTAYLMGKPPASPSSLDFSISMSKRQCFLDNLSGAHEILHAAAGLVHNVEASDGSAPAFDGGCGFTLAGFARTFMGYPLQAEPRVPRLSSLTVPYKGKTLGSAGCHEASGILGSLTVSSTFYELAHAPPPPTGCGFTIACDRRVYLPLTYRS
jgi:hypothetical protein